MTIEISFEDFFEEDFDTGGAGAALDQTAPVISNVSPVSGAAIARDQPISFRVTDTGTLVRVLVFVQQANVELVAHDGDDFSPGFAQGSTRVAVVGPPAGFDFSLVPDAGWAEAPVIRVLGFDTGGNEAVAT